MSINGMNRHSGPQTITGQLSGRTITIPDANPAPMPALAPPGVIHNGAKAEGFGETNPIVDCSGERGAALIDCLAPNRRTEVEFSAVETIEVEETVPVSDAQ